MTELLIAPMQFLVRHPERIAIVGCVFLVMVGWLYDVRRQIAWPAFAIALLWFALWL